MAVTPPAHSDNTLPTSGGAQAILEAATALFAEQGYDAVSISAIAVRAGVSKANIFHHFSSKNELYLAVLRKCCDESAQVLHAPVEDGNFQSRLSDINAEYLDHLLSQEAMSRLILREVLENGPHRGQELAEQVFGENFARLVTILRRAQQDGQLRQELDPAMIAVLMVGANVFFFESRHVLRHFADVTFADDPSQYREMLVDILLKGIQPADTNTP
jgi:TetR/AcrR family transcriptional regulator